jgi:hypothetical protein
MKILIAENQSPVIIKPNVPPITDTVPAAPKHEMK